MIHRKIITFGFFIALGLHAFAQSSNTEKSGFKSFFKNLDYEVNAGVNLGGASPLPLPSEIRKIDSFDPNLNLQIGVKATKWTDAEKKWGIALAINFENRGMETKATVKNYGMSIIQNGGILTGRWTGKVQTKYQTQQLIVPVTAVLKAHSRISVELGPYFAYAFKNSFEGYVSEGYLREGDPTGQKVEFEGDAMAHYDFDDELRSFQWGVKAEISWNAIKHFLINANLSWGLNDIFKSSFKTITFNMYAIYFNVGFGYKF